MTYRARLLGTAETDSGLLISLMKEWVSGEDGIIMRGVLVTVDFECSVAISSLSEEMCSTTQPPVTTTNITPVTAAIIGGTVTVLIITFAVVAIILTLILKKHKGKLSVIQIHLYLLFRDTMTIPSSYIASAQLHTLAYSFISIVHVYNCMYILQLQLQSEINKYMYTYTHM